MVVNFVFIYIIISFWINNGTFFILNTITHSIITTMQVEELYDYVATTTDESHILFFIYNDKFFFIDWLNKLFALAI